MPKEKLTLSVDREVVKKAKSLGLNISELTELALRGFSFSAKDANSNALYGLYNTLFDSMKLLLEMYGASVKIASVGILDDQGNCLNVSDVSLGPDGRFCWEEVGDTFIDIKKIPTNAFCTPKEILSSLVDALAEAAQKRRETMLELEMARRIVNAITSTLQTGAASKTKARRERLSG